MLQPTICHKGFTNPYHIDHKALIAMLDVANYLYQYTFNTVNNKPEGAIRTFMREMYDRLTKGDWSTEEKMETYFESLNDKDRKSKSMDLMRIIGIAYNIEFIILETFNENDMNSM